MAGVANPNYKTFYQGAVGDRYGGPGLGLTPDWTGGMNKGASNAPGIGINTGDYSPKTSDWSQHTRDPQNSQTISHTAAAVTTEPDGNDNASFIQTIASTAPDAQVGTTGVFNRTGKTIPTGTWFWGHKPIA